MSEMKNDPAFLELVMRVKGAAVFAGWKRNADWQKAIDHLAARAKQADALEDVIRGLAAYVGAGGYNAEKVDPEVFGQKIRWGIDHLSSIPTPQPSSTPNT